jgi:hypothetical protein
MIGDGIVHSRPFLSCPIRRFREALALRAPLNFCGGWLTCPFHWHFQRLTLQRGFDWIKEAKSLFRKTPNPKNCDARNNLESAQTAPENLLRRILRMK